jgi:hypothetical protein
MNLGKVGLTSFERVVLCDGATGTISLVFLLDIWRLGVALLAILRKLTISLSLSMRNRLRDYYRFCAFHLPCCDFVSASLGHAGESRMSHKR